MSNQLSEEKLNKLLLALSPLAKHIATGNMPDQDALKQVLLSVGAEREEWALEELELWAKILQKASTASNDAERAAIEMELQNRGIPEASTILAVDIVCPPIAPLLSAAEEEQFPEKEKLNKLLRALLPLAKRIGTGIVPEEHVLKEILFSVGVEAEEWAIEKLVFWAMILQKASTASNDAERAAIEMELQNRGIPEASAVLAVDTVCHPIAPSLIATEEARSPEENIRSEIARHNFVRAVMLAQQHEYPQDKVQYLQKLALKQYASEYRNVQGLHKLMQEYGFSEAEVEQILKEDLEEHGV